MPNKKEKSRKKSDIFKLSAICGVLIIIFTIVGFILSSLLSENVAVSSAWSIFQGVLVALLTVVFYYGFYALGKKYDSKLLRIMSLIIIIFTVVAYIISLFFLSPVLVEFSSNFYQKVAQLNMLPSDQQQTAIQNIFSDPSVKGPLTEIIALLGSYLLVFVVCSILFGIALMKLKDRVKHSKVAGILEIVGGATSIIFVGFLVIIVAFIFELIILFKEAEK